MTINLGSADAGLLVHYSAFFALSGRTIQHPSFYRIVWLVHPLWRHIVAVASVLGGASQLQGLSLVFLQRIIFVRVGCF